MSADSRFGLVREAPEFLVWVKRYSRWQVEGGAATWQRAQRLAATRGRYCEVVVLPRGEQPRADVEPGRIRRALLDD